MQLIESILLQCDFNELEKSEWEIQLLKEIENLKKKKPVTADEIINTITSKESPLMYLKNLVNNHQKVTLSRYLKSSGNILLFIPCNKNPDLIKITNILKALAKDTDTFVIENLNDY